MPLLRRNIGVLRQILGFSVLHFLFFGRHFVDGSAVLVGDSQIAISLNNPTAYTFTNYHEFLWWDPTGLDGYPALVNLTHGWFNYLNPIILPGHLFVWGVTSLLHWPLVTAAQVQLFSIVYLTALIFVVLLSHELIRSPVARLLPPLVFTLGVSANQFFMLAQHGPALAPTLAYLFGLVYFWRRRTPSSFFVFLLFLHASWPPSTTSRSQVICFRWSCSQFFLLRLAPIFWAPPGQHCGQPWQPSGGAL